MSVATPAPGVEAPVFGDPFIKVFVEGDPVTQGSISRGQHGNMFNDHHDELMWWRTCIETAVRRQRGRYSRNCIEGPVVASMAIFVDRARHPQWRSHPIGRESGGTDLSKMVRAIEDGFARTTFHVKTGRDKGQKVTRGAEAISDDGNIVASAEMKLFTSPGQPEPGVRLQVWQVDREAERAGWVPVPDWPAWRYVSRDTLYGW